MKHSEIFQNKEHVMEDLPVEGHIRPQMREQFIKSDSEKDLDPKSE